MNYIDVFRKIIKEQVNKSNGDKKFIDNLFNQIKDEVISIYGPNSLVGLPQVDETTLKSYYDTAKNEYLSVNPIDPGLSHSLTKKGFKTWLTEEREKSISWDYSDRYFKHLKNLGRSEKVIDETINSSLSILRKMADPKSGAPIYNKGLVVGAVQSGKTGNFNAVINRAIDAGYEIVIVLAGIMEDLRSQTQQRIEKDIIGEGKIDSGEPTGTKGVGKIRRFGVRGDEKVIQVKSLTSETKDFGKAVKELDHTLNDKYVLVCKKNVSVLKNLIIWLHNSLESGKDKHNIPLLIIDDEADNASLNNMGAKGRNYASKTNGHIRAILELFHVKSYLGYTATPFANVLQDRNVSPENDWEIKYKFKGDDVEKLLKRVDNIFPDDFIELLSPPSNYVGAKQIFETITPIENQTDENEKIPLIAPPVDDFIEYFPSRVYQNRDGEIVGVENIRNRAEWDEKFGFGGYLDFDSYNEYRKETWAPRKEDPFPKELPESLKTAIKCFIIALAIREFRIPSMVNSDLYQPHNTMLVHVSRFTFWQNTTKTLIEKYVNEIVSKINNDRPSSSNSIYTDLEKLWYSNYGFAHIVQNVKSYLPRGYEDEFMSPLVFDSLVPVFISAVRGIEIKAINSHTKDTLEYPKNSPKKIIAIGGNRLSRGFTLEGLTINYFIRVTNYSDALLQMGRWFGYRPGYLDCCKIFTSKDSLDKFNDTTRCIEELESEFIKMEDQGKTPEKFVLRVRKHPGTLKITRPAILKNAKEVKWSYQDSLVMTTQLKVDKKSIEDIWNNFKNNIAPRFQESERDDILKYKTDAREVIRILKTQPNNFNDNDPEYLTKFIELCFDKGYLSNWTIALKTTGASPNKKSKEEIGLSNSISKNVIELSKRSGPTNDDDVRKFLNESLFKASSKSANIISANTDMSILLSKDEKSKAESDFYKHKASEIMKRNKGISLDTAMNEAKTKTVPERYYRGMMKETEGLLMIYLFDSYYAFNQEFTNNKDPQKKKELEELFRVYVQANEIDLKIPLVGYAIEFPPIDNDPGGVYLQGDYDLNEECEICGEVDCICNDNEDELEGISDYNE
ncbi:Z1 domain-containing protein [Algoriphagus sp. SE2]|uniref:Z1 domain-containing protein n=1 Tax=Algoriphagus sp. SE2 TaxID=3141536 RepID=UPI0031CD85B8